MSSFFLSRELLHQCWQDTLSKFRVFDQYEDKERHLAVVVVDKTRPWVRGMRLDDMTVLFRWNGGGESLENSDIPHIEVAHRKAFASWRTGQTIQDLWTNNPDLLELGDPTYADGSFIGGSYIIACSGLDPEHNTLATVMLSRQIREACKTAALQALRRSHFLDDQRAA